MEDDGRPVAIEHLAQPLVAPDVRDHRHAGREIAVVDELALDLVQRRFGLVDEDRAARRPPERPGGRARSRSSRRRPRRARSRRAGTRRSPRSRRPRARGRGCPRPARAGSAPRGWRRRRSARTAPAASSPAHVRHARARRPSGARRRRRTESRSGARRAGCRGGCASAPRSSRARGRRGAGGSSCAGRRRRTPIGVYPSARDFCISRITSWPASPAPTTITSLPRATRLAAPGRSKIVRASRREPATSPSRSSQSRIAIPRGSRAVSAGGKK